MCPPCSSLKHEQSAAKKRSKWLFEALVEVLLPLCSKLRVKIGKDCGETRAVAKAQRPSSR
jgi:hypothetical protein